MRLIYRGPAKTLTLAGGKVVTPGQPCTISKATREALEAMGCRFSEAADEAPETQADPRSRAQAATRVESPAGQPDSETSAKPAKDGD